MERLILAALFVLAGLGCPGDTADAGPVASCVDASVGTQCRIDGGKLGVCMMDASGKSFCQDQH